MAIWGKPAKTGPPGKSLADGYSVFIYPDLGCVSWRRIFPNRGWHWTAWFPDFYTRMHATGMTDTLGVGLMLLGMMMQAGLTITAVKLAFIGFFIFFTSPTSTYDCKCSLFSRFETEACE